MNMETDIDADQHRVTFRVTGELDLSTSPSLGSAVEAHQVASGHDVVIELDLEAVTFADSSALAMLVRLRRSLGDRLVVQPSPNVRRTLEVSGLLELFELDGHDGQDGRDG